MKKLLLSFSIILMIAGSMLAQAPQSFKYQAIARDADGQVLSNQQISLRIELHQGTEYGQTAYSEIHDVRTNQFGLVNLEIGNGKTIYGEFAKINWALSKYFVNIEIDVNGGSNYISMGVSPLLSVP